MIQKVEISVDFGFGLSISKCGGLKCLVPCNVGNFWRVIRISILGFEVSPPICGCWVTWLGFEVSPLICRYWVTWLGLEVSPPVCRYWVAWLGFEVSPLVYRYWISWLGFEVSCNLDMGLWCCNSRVSSMLTGFSTVIGVMGLELELLTWVSTLGSLCNLPLDLDQILSPLSLFRTGSFGSVKARSPSASNNQAKQTHTTCIAILIGTDLKVGSMSLCCRLGLLFYCFPIARTLHLPTCNVMNIVLVWTAWFFHYSQ